MRFSRFLPGFALLILFAALLSNCDTIDNLPASFANKTTATSTPGATNTPTSQANASQPSLPVVTPDPSQVMTVWLPPDLNPNSSSAASKLMAQRLDAFQKQNGSIKINIRIKNLSGPHGMLETLAITHQAAPLAMPSIVVLQQTDLEQAVRQALVFPVTNLQSMLNSADWYPFAQDMAQVGNKWYGVPFSGDALILIYRADSDKTVINTWDDILKLNQLVIFPASDPDALTTLALYQSLSGNINTATPTPALQEKELGQVFSFYQLAARQGVFPYSLSQYERFDQTWTAYRNHQSRLVVTWASTYLKDPEPEDQALPLPGLNGTPYTLATGSMFVLSEANPDRQKISLELIDFLVEPAFISQLNQAVGNIPTRITANNYPEDPNKQVLFDKIGKSAHLLPVLPVYFPLTNHLKEAAVQIIRLQLSPQDAVKSVLTTIQKTP
jgi:multiple sugar transport system substrate-binding protein